MKDLKTAAKNSRDSFINYGIVIAAFAVVQVMSMTGHLTNSLKGQLVPICVYVIMALALNLVVGISGELSLGHAGFMSVGAFTGVIVCQFLKDAVSNGILRFVIGMVAAAIMAAIAGVLIGIPVLRLRGDYLAIVTLAFGEIIKNVVTCIYLGYDQNGFHISLESANKMGMDPAGKVLLNGPQGAQGVAKLSSFGIGIVMVLVTLFIIQNFVNSQPGRAVMAIRDNRIAAEACGLNVTRYKMMTFVLSASIAGAAGCLYALNFSTVVAKKFDFNTSILILVFVVLGGIGSMRGAIIAATILTILPELLRQFADYRMLIYAIVLILVMIATNNDKVKNLLSFKKKGGADHA